MTKTSISLDPDFIQVLDDYRRQQDKIPTISEAIRELVKKAVRVKEENTEVPKDRIEFKEKTISIEKARGRFLIRFDPKDLDILKQAGWIEGTKINVWLSVKE